MQASLKLKAAVLSFIMLALFLGIWEGVNITPEDSAPMSEYEMLMGAPLRRRASHHHLT